MDRIEKLLEDDTLTPNFFINGLSPLVVAARMPTEPQLLEALLQHGQIDVNMTDCEGRSALSYAAEFQQLQSLKSLLCKGAKHDLQDSGGRTPLSWAATAGEPDHFLPAIKEVIEQLLAAGADVNAEDWKKRTPLAWATIKGNKATAELFLSVDNVNADIPDTDGRTPLSHAAELGLAEIVQLLLDSNADINLEDKCGRTPLLWATQKGHETIVSELLASVGVDVDHLDPDGRSPLSHAAELGRGEIIQLLLTSRADINLEDKLGRTPLLWATRTGHETIVYELLASPGVDVDLPDRDGRAALSFAAELGYASVVQTLVSAHAYVNSEDNTGRTPLVWATVTRRADIVQSLLASGFVDLDHRDSDGRTAIFHAASLGYDDIMELLMQNGANAFCTDKEGHTPFWALLSTRSRRQEYEPIQNPFHIINLIMSLPDPDVKDQDGRTLLSWAAEFGDEALVQALILRDGNPNIRDPGQWAAAQNGNFNRTDAADVVIFRKTPLIWALENEEESIVQLLKDIDRDSLHLLLSETSTIGEQKALDLVRALIDQGYNINQTDAEGKTPLHLACTMADDQFASALILGRAHLNIQDNSRKTPLQYALTEKRVDTVRELLKHGADIKPIPSVIWLALGNKASEYVQLSQMPSRQKHTMELLTVMEKHSWIPSAGERRLWTLNSAKYDGCVASHMAVSFPFKNQHGSAKRSEQLTLRGRSRQLIDELARIALRRTELRRGLQQHVVGLRRAIETDTTIKVEEKPCLAEMIQDIDISTMAVLDDVEKSVRELLQIVGIQANSPHFALTSSGIRLGVNQ
ncbi:ankyrin repeat domain-containing protein [Aspergillus fischeri NRRL 181]|uniref:protein S-acyltransferase n=1 Tax=Neosartorya fischeri (strain ATCC 1020 / DSM 3700 / CBS 544.65 / FGSC A1164 / JCM 1740 / NRRL 181 / WB 181) TaxID=331117 RepID=A1D8J5_NEOFI|nr:Ankyrin repeat protein [Aspergillus fischeri NRRL 181]EAW20706.1 Ankyrin repeat protein [Aspergillus fischeri NRRL 181]